MALQDAFDDRPFSTLLKQQGLDEQLQHVLLHAIALSPWSKPEDSSEETAAACSTGGINHAQPLLCTGRQWQSLSHDRRTLLLMRRACMSTAAVRPGQDPLDLTSIV